MVRPAVAIVRATASPTSTLAGQLLAEPADHQQRVVDAQAQPQRGGEVDREDADAR